MKTYSIITKSGNPIIQGCPTTLMALDGFATWYETYQDTVMARNIFPVSVIEHTTSKMGSYSLDDLLEDIQSKGYR